MARFMIKASEYKNVCKAVNERKLAELKKEIIEILKKQDEKEVKKAIDYFNSQELHYTYLEKSLSGKWIEKAGYGIGTVRIWKGKKYKKIAPGKWARVFEKEGRGTNIAIGKLIARVQKIDNVEDLMDFVMQNKQRFVDENGVDLPVLDKLRAAVDVRNGNVGSKEKTVEDKIKENPDYPFKPKTDKERAERAAFEKDRDDFIERMDKIRQENKKKDSKPAEKEEESKTYWIQDNRGNRLTNEDAKKKIIGQMKYLAELEGMAGKKLNNRTANDIRYYIDYLKDRLNPEDRKEIESEAEKTKNEESNSEDIKRAKEKIKQYAGKKINSNEISDIKILDDGERSGFLTFEFKSGNDKYKMTYDSGFGGEKGGVSIKKIESEESENKEEKKVIENNPKSIEGMEFVNKNKMHVLANFLANHDNVNMATAVIRLQAAYEKLGEEKFLSYFPKDVVERYRKESGKEETKTETPKFTPKKDFKSMSDDELKDYEAKLEKDLLNTNRNDSDYMDKYNHWREVHGENNDRFHQRIEDEARAEKQAEADAKSAKEKEIKEKYHGYFDSRSGLDKARDLKTLEKKYNFDGKVMSSKEFVEQAMDNGVEIKEREVNKLDYPSRTRWNRMNGYEQDEYEKRIKAAGKKTVYSINGFEFPKTVVDYAKFYKENGKSKTESEKPSKSEIAIKNKATSLAGAFGYSKTYATKMGSPFNLELAEQTVDEELDWDDGSKKALKEELRRIYSEKKVQKSLFDDFIMDVFEADKEEEIEDAIKADETEYNDYSAEQPELFNSTAMKVREALDRIKNQVL